MKDLQALPELPHILERYPTRRAAIMDVLRLVQQRERHVSEESLQAISSALEVPLPEVRAIMSFYTMYFDHPVGQYLISVCDNVSCRLRGSDDLLEHLQQRFGLQLGETTEDGRFTLQTVECLAACGGAPVVQINDTYHEDLTVEKLDRILDDLAAS